MYSARIQAAIAGMLGALLIVSCGSDGGGGDGDASCGSEPAAPECRSLCDLACARVAPCGIDAATCKRDCYTVYACPGETPGQDGSICRGALTALPALCADLCKWAGNFGGYARQSGVTCNARAWQSLDVAEDRRCTTPPCASSWSVQADGSLTSMKQGMSGSGALTTSDLSALDALISSPAFDDGMRNGFNCAAPPADATVSFRLQTATEPLTRDVSGCVLSGPDGNAAQAAFAIVSSY